ncbi:MAG: cytochrome d ubiquinol oxidase subunit II, partial [Polyangiaceae bacterium]
GFAGSSFLLAFVFGATFGNVVRGVPVDDDGFFSTPLFTHFFPTADAGALDLYTASIGLFAVLALTLHGCLYLRWKTSGPVAERATEIAKKMFIVVLAIDVAVAVASSRMSPSAMHAFLERPLAWVFAAIALGGAGLLGKSLRGNSERDELLGFVGSCVFLAATLIAGACALFPVLLRSTLSDSYSLDAIRNSSGAHGLALGLVWYVPAITLAAAYLVYVLRETRGKARPDSH